MRAVTTAVPATGTRMGLPDWELLSYDHSDRVELIEGVVVVTSSPSELHQAVVTQLVVALHQACPDDYRVRAGPLGVLVRDLSSGLLPDLVVLRADDRSTLDRLPGLVVEVLSPSTRGRDEVDKCRLYGRRRIPSYWLVDPEVPSMRILELGAHHEYVEVAHVVGTEPVQLIHPFPVRLVPADLIR